MKRLRRTIRAAAHELRCVECRVTWRSWVERIAGIHRDYQ